MENVQELFQGIMEVPIICKANQNQDFDEQDVFVKH